MSRFFVGGGGVDEGRSTVLQVTTNGLKKKSVTFLVNDIEFVRKLMMYNGIKRLRYLKESPLEWLQLAAKRL